MSILLQKLLSLQQQTNLFFTESKDRLQKQERKFPQKFANEKHFFFAEKEVLSKNNF